MQKCQVSRGTVQRAKNKQTTELMYQKENNRNTKMSRLHNATSLNTLVFRWFSLVRSQGFPISGPIMQEKAKQLALLLGIDNFHASDGFQERGIFFEPNDIPEMLDDDAEDDLAEMLQSMSLEDEPYFEEDLECYEPFTQDIVNYVFQEYDYAQNVKELEDDGEEFVDVEAIMERERVSHDDPLSFLSSLELYYEQQKMIIQAGNVAKMMREIHSKQVKCLVPKSILHYF